MADLARLLTEAGLSHIAEEILALQRSSIRIAAPENTIGSEPARFSRIGGLPDLPEGVSWPIWKGRGAGTQEPQEAPLCFLAQIRLSEVKKWDSDDLLPSEGDLSFFAVNWIAAIGQGAGTTEWVVLYSPDEKLPRHPAVLPPVPEFAQQADYAPPEYQFVPRRLVFAKEETLPDYRSKPMQRLFKTEAEVEKYYDVLEALFTGRASGLHRLLGYPQEIQGLMEESLRRTTGEKWHLLLQVDTQPDIHLYWQGWGRAYFWIRESDLAVHNFDRVKLIMQCT